MTNVQQRAAQVLVWNPDHAKIEITARAPNSCQSFSTSTRAFLRRYRAMIKKSVAARVKKANSTRAARRLQGDHTLRRQHMAPLLASTHRHKVCRMRLRYLKSSPISAWGELHIVARQYIYVNPLPSPLSPLDLVRPCVATRTPVSCKPNHPPFPTPPSPIRTSALHPTHRCSALLQSRCTPRRPLLRWMTFHTLSRVPPHIYVK